MKKTLRQSTRYPGDGVSRAYRVVLVKLTHNTVTPYVTWMKGDDGETYWGHYHKDRLTAEAEYVNRCRQYDLDPGE